MSISGSRTHTVGDGLDQAYSPRFYAGQASGSLDSARAVLQLLYGTYQPKSVLDVGCGLGGWLAAAEELGCQRLVGVDGAWVDPQALISKRIEFSNANLEKDFNIAARFDLCISVEVAEHLPADCARAFVERLCAASDVVLFSAAIRLQGGTYHQNEQWQSYWADMFQEAGYDCFDFFRPQLWTNQRVESWYRQNILLYVERSHPIADAMRRRSLLRGPLDIVHPEIFEGNIENLRRTIEDPTLKFCCQSFALWGRRQIMKVFRH
jgi:SAM-dependent methyltransferase